MAAKKDGKDSFLASVKEEWSLVSWAKRRDVVKSALTVILVSCLIGALILGTDTVIAAIGTLFTAL